MGADIHLIMERKFEGRWIGVECCTSRQIYSDVENPKEGEPRFKRGYFWHRASTRNYALFGALAGVRREGPKPKGMPEDASDLAKVMSDKWDSDGHSHSWCSIQEYIQTLISCEEKPAEVFLLSDDPRTKDPYGYYFGMYEPEDNEEYRLVFWFDN